MQQGYYTSAQAASMLGVTERTVHRWCKDGRLKGAGLRYGSRKFGWRIPAESVAEVMEVHPYVEVQDPIPA